MKLYGIIGTTLFLIMSGCAHTNTKTTDEAVDKPSSESTKQACTPKTPGYPKCPTGGGLTGPIENQ